MFVVSISLSSHIISDAQGGAFFPRSNHMLAEGAEVK